MFSTLNEYTHCNKDYKLALSEKTYLPHKPDGFVKHVSLVLPINKYGTSLSAH